MQTKLKFGLEEFTPVEQTIDEDYEQKKQERFSKVKIRLFGDGENAHTEPVDFEVLKNSADSAYDIPLIAELNPYRSNEDFGGHGVLTGKEFSFGFVKESEDNPIVFEKDENGKTFITLYGLIWKKYFNNVVEIIHRNEDQVEVSVELDIIKGGMSKRGKPLMKQFVLNAITFLGQITSAACKGAQAQLVFSNEDEENFNKDKTNYIMKHFADTIKIDNTKEAAVDGKWTNPRQKLLAPILKASNKTALLNEAYLFWEDKGEEGITLSDVSYPHHVVKDGKLVLHIRGVQAAFARLAQQGKVEGKAKAHLLRHYRELGLNTENFEDFGLTKEQFEQFFAEDCRKEESGLYEEKDKAEEMACKGEESEIKEECKEKELSTDGEQECAEEGIKESEEPKEGESEENTDDGGEANEEGDEEKDEEEMSSNNGVPPQEPLETADEVTVEELKERIQKLEADNEAYLAKIDEMSDYEELKEFKESTLAKEEQEKEMCEMRDVLESMVEKGIEISEELKEQLYGERQNFENITAWSNYVKAYAFDNCERDENGIISFEIPNRAGADKDTSLGVWAKLK